MFFLSKGFRQKRISRFASRHETDKAGSVYCEEIRVFALFWISGLEVFKDEGQAASGD
jgi:hypothetical protein